MLYVKETQDASGARRPAGAAADAAGAPSALEDLDARARDRRLRGSGFYSLPRRREEVPVATPYGPPSAPVRVGEHGGHGRGVHAPPRRRAHAAAAPHQLPGQRLGDERGGGRRASSARRPAGRSSRSSSPGTFVICDQFVDRTAAGRAPSTTGRRPPTSRPPTPTAPISGGSLVEAARERGDPGGGGRHGGRDPGAALLDPGGVALVRRRGLRRGQHDPVPRVLAGPRAGALLRERRRS